MAMTPDFEETLRKIDEDLGFNPAAEDAAPISVNKINSFEKPLAQDHKSTSKVLTSGIKVPASTLETIEQHTANQRDSNRWLCIGGEVFAQLTYGSIILGQRLDISTIFATLLDTRRFLSRVAKMYGAQRDKSMAYDWLRMASLQYQSAPEVRT